LLGSAWRDYTGRFLTQSVVLYGAACELAKSGKAGDVQIIFGCPNVPIP
jgi:hypothetical protein